eukprot:Skav212823  [mRNA]  locus=scaffold5083:74527:95030:- [translate_table: standard]
MFSACLSYCRDPHAVDAEEVQNSTDFNPQFEEILVMIHVELAIGALTAGVKECRIKGTLVVRLVIYFLDPPLLEMHFTQLASMAELELSEARQCSWMADLPIWDQLQLSHVIEGSKLYGNDFHLFSKATSDPYVRIRLADDDVGQTLRIEVFDWNQIVEHVLIGRTEPMTVQHALSRSRKPLRLEEDRGHLVVQLGAALGAFEVKLQDGRQKSTPVTSPPNTTVTFAEAKSTVDKRLDIEQLSCSTETETCLFCHVLSILSLSEIRLGVKLDSESQIELTVMGVKVGIHRLQVRGEIAIRFEPLLGQTPVIGGLVMCFLNPPKLAMDPASDPNKGTALAMSWTIPRWVLGAQLQPRPGLRPQCELCMLRIKIDKIYEFPQPIAVVARCKDVEKTSNFVTKAATTESKDAKEKDPKTESQKTDPKPPLRRLGTILPEEGFEKQPVTLAVECVLLGRDQLHLLVKAEDLKSNNLELDLVDKKRKAAASAQ